MSTEKKTIDNIKVIRFYFVTDTLFEAASAQASKKAASVKAEDFDNYQLSEDEKDFITERLIEGMGEVFNTMPKLVVGVIVHDATYTPLGGNAAETVYIDLKDNERYTPAQLGLFNHSITQTLIDFILYKWYVMKELDEAKLRFDSFSGGLTIIASRTYSFRKTR